MAKCVRSDRWQGISQLSQRIKGVWAVANGRYNGDQFINSPVLLLEHQYPDQQLHVF